MTEPNIYTIIRDGKELVIRGVIHITMFTDYEILPSDIVLDKHGNHLKIKKLIPHYNNEVEKSDEFLYNKLYLEYEDKNE